ncbi:HutD family protein [Steroidobacter agaridevorans]|uniref:HutD family protein n=1 Tax=Steroidobacter agaridevorans TaxID=2695856 RepID=UPI00137B442C|nr:HutD family protein [Steroidobacter agaridevorans]
MRPLRAAGYRRLPWKNGGGETRAILVSPPGAAGTAVLVVIELFEQPATRRHRT